MHRDSGVVLLLLEIIAGNSYFGGCDPHCSGSNGRCCRDLCASLGRSVSPEGVQRLRWGVATPKNRTGDCETTSASRNTVKQPSVTLHRRSAGATRTD